MFGLFTKPKRKEADLEHPVNTLIVSGLEVLKVRNAPMNAGLDLRGATAAQEVWIWNTSGFPIYLANCAQPGDIPPSGTALIKWDEPMKVWLRA